MKHIMRFIMFSIGVFIGSLLVHKTAGALDIMFGAFAMSLVYWSDDIKLFKKSTDKTDV